MPGETNHPRVREAARHVVEACANAGISCMTQIADVSKATVEDALDQGYTAIVMGSDLFILWKWAVEVRELIHEVR